MPGCARRERLEIAPRHRDDAARAAHPEVPQPVFPDEVNLVARQAVIGRELRQPARLQQEESGPLSPDPQSELGILVQRPDFRAAERFEQRIADECARPEPRQPTLGRHPEALVAIEQQAADAPVDQAGRRREAAEGPGAPVAQSPIGADPEATLTVLTEGPHEVVDQPFLHRVSDEGVAVETCDALAVGADPQAALAVAKDVADDQAGQSRRQRNRNERLTDDLEQPPVERHDEDGPARILVDRVDAQRGAIGRRDGVRGARLQAKHAALRPDPDVLLRIFEDSQHVVVRERDRGRQRHETLVLEAHQAPSVRADPQVAAAAFPQHADVGAVHEPRGRERIAANAAIQPAQSGDRADPDRTVARFPNGANAVVGAALGRAVVRGETAAQDQQARSAHEKPPLAILTDGVHADRGNAVPAVNALEHVPFHSEQTPVGSDPQPAAPVFEHHANEGVRQALSRPERAEGALPVADQAAAFGPRPDGSVARRQQRVDAVVAERGLVAGVEHGEAHAVETRQAAARPDPQVAVRRLRERLGEILRQALGALPDPAAVEIRPRRRVGTGRLRRRPCHVEQTEQRQEIRGQPDLPDLASDSA